MERRMGEWVLSVDPGMTTGAVVGLFVNKHLATWQQQQFGPADWDNWETDYHLNAHAIRIWAHRQLELMVPETMEVRKWLVMEDFLLFISSNRGLNSQRAGLAACRMGSHIKFIMNADGFELALQQPSQIKGSVKGAWGVRGPLATERKAAALGYDKAHPLWIPGKQHSRDAMKHMIVWARKHGFTVK